ncbi:MAG: hypothetical protein K8J08_11180, partial [Thermoanaerobaculia bacterium]|nr:hypothetical protein [Thermoanaerobaculia bacterium]
MQNIPSRKPLSTLLFLSVLVLASAAAPTLGQDVGAAPTPAVDQSTPTEEPTPAQLFADYEAIRSALLQDTLEGVTDSAARIQRVATVLVEDAAPADQSALRDLAKAAEELTLATDLVAARKGLPFLTAPMIDLRHLAPEPAPVIAFCPMVDERWLQPEEAIGNPYFGQEMAT